MRLSDSSPSRQSLEQSLERLLSATSAAHYPNRAKQAWLKPLLTKFLNFMTGNESIQIVQRRDRYGDTYWDAYDPATHSHHRFDTEQEVRIWLDQRFYP